jgi:DNA polymerase elongation subunit (family B)
MTMLSDLSTMVFNWLTRWLPIASTDRQVAEHLLSENLCVAACTTAAGRKALYYAKKVVESQFGAEVVYGDTDSIFVKFPAKDLSESIRLGLEAGNAITTQMNRKPYKIAYEKTFYPFILFCRKRYVGMKYEEDPNPAKAKRMSMGIVLKRRDNAPIVKDVFGGALDVLLQEQDVRKAATFVKQKLKDVLDHKIPLEKFIVSKSLRDDYKNPGSDCPSRLGRPHGGARSGHGSEGWRPRAICICRRRQEGHQAGRQD